MDNQSVRIRNVAEHYGVTIALQPRATSCLFCYCRALETTWDPKGGYDPNMREYVCDLGHLTYVIMKPRPAKAPSMFPLG